MAKYTHDIVIVGAGAAGLSVASGCAQLGMKTALIEGEKTGGDCLYFGCVPSKALIRSAAAARAADTLEDYGLAGGNRGPSSAASVSRRIQKIIQQIQPHDSPQRFRGLGAEVFVESARFVDPHSLELAGGGRVSAKKIVLATGSRASTPPIPGLREAGFLTNRDLFTLEAYPQSILVLGAGPIGVELGQALVRLGCRVVLVEAADRILPRENRELSASLHAALVAEGIEVRTGARISAVRSGSASKTAVLEDGTTLEVEEVLVAAGRQANIENLNLDAAGVRTKNGFISVDKRLRTNVRHILAVGDCNGAYLFTPVAGAEAGIAVRRLALGLPAAMDYSLVPTVVYSDPELASVGVSEEDAVEQGLRVESFDFDANDRARTESPDGRPIGAAKLVLDSRNRLRGVHILAAGAGELLLPGILAVKERWGIRRFLSVLCPYPTQSEFYRQIAGRVLGPALFNPKVRSILRVSRGYRGTGPVQ